MIQAIIALVSGTFVFILLPMASGANRINNHGVKVEGTITGVDEDEGVFVPIISFKTTGGEPISGSPIGMIRNVELNVGDSITVIYDPKKAKNFSVMIAEPMDNTMVNVMIIISILLCAWNVLKIVMRFN